MKHAGGCHCGNVAFEFEAPDEVTVYQCNCSICELTAYQHLIIPTDHFKLLTPDTNLSSYSFNTGIAQHYFCLRCGIKSWYIPRSNPDGVSVNFRCVAKSTFTRFDLQPFDGQNWEANASALVRLSHSDKQSP